MPRTAKVTKEGSYLLAVEEIDERFKRIRQGLVNRGFSEGATYDPLVELAAMAHSGEFDAVHRSRLHSEVAEYLYPKVRNLEVSNPNNQQVKVVIEIAPYAKLEEKSVEADYQRVQEESTEESCSEYRSEKEEIAGTSMQLVQQNRPKIKIITTI